MNEAEIKTLMKEKKLTVMGLAKRFKRHHTTIHFLIKRQMKSDYLEKRLARALGVKVAVLRGETETVQE